MVNAGATEDWPHVERRLILSYAQARARPALAALLALDDTLGGVLRATREPIVGQMRLTWWHDALTRLDTASPPAHPVLRDLSAAGLPGTELARMIDGWEELLEPGALADEALMRFAQSRGGALFSLAAEVLGASDTVASAGEGWALADLARHSTTAGREAVLAPPLLAASAARRWSRAGRPLGAMVHLARMNDAMPAAKTVRALWHRVTGR